MVIIGGSGSPACGKQLKFSADGVATAGGDECMQLGSSLWVICVLQCSVVAGGPSACEESGGLAANVRYESLSVQVWSQHCKHALHVCFLYGSDPDAAAGILDAPHLCVSVLLWWF
jgi:hypothetical protein